MSCERCIDYDLDQFYIRDLENMNKMMQVTLMYIIDDCFQATTLAEANGRLEMHKNEAQITLGELDD